MIFDVKLDMEPMTLTVEMGEVYDVSGDEYERGYEDGYQSGKMDGKTDVSTLDRFTGAATENPNEYFYSSVSVDSIWVPTNYIPFSGLPGKQYTATAALKCGAGLTNFGIAFLHDDGTYSVSDRYSLSEYFAVSTSSVPEKTVAAVGYVYGTNGNGWVKDFLLQENDT